MIKLSVNVNKIATLRNSRGNNVPNLELVTQSIINFGADGITIHPRPDQRHIRHEDVVMLADVVKPKVEFNIEGYPSDEFIKLVVQTKPTQVTLVPDSPNVLTSLQGWNTIKERPILRDVIQEFKSHSIRSSLFVHPNIKMIEGASNVGADRIELFTGIYARSDKKINLYIESSKEANKMGLGVNAGHDLNLKNLSFFVDKVPFLDEVSIGHALISESLFLGLENTINMYKRILE